MARFLEAAPGVKYKAAFSVAYGAGLRVSEVASLKVHDIDSERMMLRVEQGKGGPQAPEFAEPSVSRHPKSFTKKRTFTPIVEFVCIAEQSLQSHAACDGCEAIEWRRQIAARILYS